MNTMNTMNTMAETDSCLVLCIEDRDVNNYEKINARLFITYDFELETYVLYGRRQNRWIDNNKTSFEPYFFRMDTVDDAYEFVKLVISKNSPCSYTLYNYNNMPITCDTVDYYAMESNMHVNYEIVAYDDVRIKRKQLSTLLQMLYSVYNHY